ncbi:MAG: ABC transporter permease [Bacillales bacterium]
MNNINTFFKEKFSIRKLSPILASIICAIFGLLIGAIIIIFIKPQSADRGIYNLFFGGFKNIPKILYLATPILLTGLSVSFAYKCGLFNIGSSGQFLAGGLVTLISAHIFHLPWYLCALFAIVAGFLYGVIPGLLKAYFNVHEVITSIMLNWIMLFITNLIILNVPGLLNPNEYKSPHLPANSVLPRINNNPYLNIGIFIAIILCIVVFIVINYTTFGYELKACGFNKDASKYAGISTTKNIVLAMAISGAISGLAGALYYLVGTIRYQPQVISVPVQGFNGIPVALLANSNPIGCIVTAFFISYLQVASDYMQPHFAKENIDLVIAIIIYLSAFALIIANLINNRKQIKEWFNKKHKIQRNKKEVK